MEDKMFELMTKMYSEMQDMRKEMATKKDIQKLEQKIVELECAVSEKIGALFDAREVQIDRETEVVTNLKRVENKVDKLELKVIRNR